MHIRNAWRADITRPGEGKNEAKPTFDISWYSCSSDCSASKGIKKAHRYNVFHAIKLAVTKSIQSY